MLFENREDAGKQLVPLLEEYRGNSKAIVLGLPRGGVVTAYEVAKGLGLPLDIIVTRKIGAPHQPELACGALAQDGHPIFMPEIMAMVGVSEEQLMPIIQEERVELKRRLEAYRHGRSPLNLKGRVAIIVDDGIATGATMLAAIYSARHLGAKEIIIAVPVADLETLSKLKGKVNKLVCLIKTRYLSGVGAYYRDFTQVEDKTVLDLLNERALK